MSYTSLYRKYRPRTFDDVIGQEHIVKTLVNQIEAGKVSHAYLLTGSRGTGKTSCAKILSRAVNCSSPVRGSPCLKCDVCKSLEDANNIDIFEIDAASNNKVDEIREIREQVQFLPVRGKYKAYIIDEVHMLTDSAFNALLKTLEEPPAHVIFILATTEAHKLPATILSRCLRFDFRLVSESELAALLRRVYDAEKKEYDDEAVRYIAGAAQGSVRDLLSIADMCLNYSSGKLTYADVLNVLGATDRNKISDLFVSVAEGDAGAALSQINSLAALGKSMQLIAKELAAFSRDLLVIKTAGGSFITDTKENIEKMSGICTNYSADLFINIIREFSSVDAELRYSVSPRIILETAALRCCRLSDGGIEALSERVRRLEGAGGGAKINAKADSADLSERLAALERRLEGFGQGGVTVSADGGTEEAKAMDAKSVWGRMTTHFRRLGEMRLYTLIGDHTDYLIENGKLVIYATDEKFLQFCEDGTLQGINAALISDGCNLSAEIKKRSVDIDVDAEITNIKKMIGKAKLNIIK